ncbi:hypothetical protein HPB50_007915 [Hyalomma asiaticum]|uniref:Uncharacterized protein n=1 Tax=Hyalomma asiaticum TaxID=266040 RepID=A0ACB7TH46_HYAAI|nr:hypothetical protein HPB50_007915 [Hyalomma asiaticum]
MSRRLIWTVIIAGCCGRFTPVAVAITMKRDSGGNGTSTDGERNVYELACSLARTLRTQRNQLRRRSKQLKQLWWQWRWHPLMAAQAVPSSVCVPLLINTGCTGGPSASAGW